MFNSALFDEKTFYDAFLKDVRNCKKEIIIESPFVTYERAHIFLPIFQELLNKGVEIYIFTRDPKEHFEGMEIQSETIIRKFEVMGVQTFLCLGNHHRKLAIIDRTILWEGSLNILSQTYSREIMRRTEGKQSAQEMFDFLKFEKFL